MVSVRTFAIDDDGQQMLSLAVGGATTRPFSVTPPLPHTVKVMINIFSASCGGCTFANAFS